MTLAFYMDHHVPSAITRGLRLLGIDVLTAQDDSAHKLSDPELLDRAKELGRILFTQDDDFLAEAHQRQKQDIPFTGIVYAHQLRVPIGVCVRDLELIANVAKFEELENRVEYLPL
jgi:predicted nuclease of predicted toxin-antitoxin system